MAIIQIKDIPQRKIPREEMRNRKGWPQSQIALLAILICMLSACTTHNAMRTATTKTTVERATALVKVTDYVESSNPSQVVLSPEGEFITVFNVQVTDWVKQEIDKPLLGEIRSILAPHLRIDINERGFAPAATRATKGKRDDTNYNAIWVRDNVWVYFSLLKQSDRQDDALKMLLALWDYYATDAQIARFSNVIADPALSQDEMAMPHIRFDGSSPDLGDVMVKGKPQVWNHRQIDAHGLFFAALGEAVSDGRVTLEDLTDKRFKVLSLYPLFLQKIDFSNYEDAGAWEEIPRKNTSSIGLATRSLQVWHDLIHKDTSHKLNPFRNRFSDLMKTVDKQVAAQWTSSSLEALIISGIETVRWQLELGGESPDYAPTDVHFRLADSALAFLVQPTPLQGLTEAEMRKILLIVETLRRPYGVLRYRNDSYQSGNYWISPPPAKDKHAAALTGDTSSEAAYIERLSRLIPDSEAQWFFDSILAMNRLYLARITEDPELRQQDLHFAAVHLKRALGQLTGETITADGEAVTSWNAPESINTVVINGRRAHLPSPITPLNWAKASLSMALDEYERMLVSPKK